MVSIPSPLAACLPRAATDFTENCTDPDSPVECLIGFVGETTIQSIKRATDDTISSWYYSVSTLEDYNMIPAKIRSTL